ncbi:MAG: hypothetical protein AAFP78_16720 [Pseudomonadota bacterium]
MRKSLKPEPLAPAAPISQEEVALAMRRAHRMRSLYIARLWRNAFAAVGRLFGLRRGRDIEYAKREALASLRSSAEILRDHPEMDTAQRRTLIDIVLAEEARLERLLKVAVDPAPLHGR